MSTKAPFVLLVSGGTASGKSTIVEKLVTRTGATLLSHDRYYHDVLQPIGHDYDHPSALDTDRLIHDLTQLRLGQPADLPVYDFATHTRQPATESCSPSSLVVVEGILVMNDDRLRALADLCVFVEAPESVRLARRIARDVRNRGRTEAGVRAQYDSTVKPNHDRFVQPSKQHASLVLDGCAPIDHSVSQIVKALPGSVLV